MAGCLESEKGERIKEQRLEGVTLKMEEGAKSQGMWAASRNWTAKKMDASLQTPARNTALLTLQF